MAPVTTWSILVMLASYRLLVPGYKISKTEEVSENDDTKSKTRKAVVMGKCVIRELAKAASIMVLFNTVGIGALSL